MHQNETSQIAPQPETLAGTFLRYHRQVAGIGLRELAREVGYSHAYLSQIENGRAVPVSTIGLIATAIGNMSAQRGAA